MLIQIHGGKNDPKKEKKAEISCFKVLDVLFGGLAVAWKPFVSSQRHKDKIVAFLLL
jgi:hypothetical protein